MRSFLSSPAPSTLRDPRVKVPIESMARSQPLEDVTQLLRRIDAGEPEARSTLFELLYDELHRRARALMKHQPPGHTLQSTALVGEVYSRLFGREAGPWADRRHFLLTASRAMKHALVDHARSKAADKRRGVREDSPLDSIVLEYEDRSLDIEALQQALLKLKEFDPEMALGIELRFFGGATVEESARALGITTRTFERRYSAVRAWLYARLK